jgi:antitoxin component YwqK of YwqJK toxin-antitoxin module
MLGKAIARLKWGLYDLLHSARDLRYPNGLRGRGPFYHGLGDKHGLWRFFYENGQMWCQGEYQMGFEVGSWTYYHSNGQPCARGVDGWRRQGTWEFWDEAGCALDETSFLTRYPALASRLPTRDDEPAGDVSSRVQPEAPADRPRN